VTYETLTYETDYDAKVATVTLHTTASSARVGRVRCEEVAAVWRRVRLDERINVVVLRSSEENFFSGGLGIPGDQDGPDVWHDEVPGELISAKWQKMWKPIVCAVQGTCSAGAFYLINESDIVICSDDATFVDPHVNAGLVSALEPIGLLRRIGLSHTLRMTLTGGDELIGAQTALAIGLVTEVVPRDQLWTSAFELAKLIAAKPSAATQGTVRAIWESLDRPYRAALEQGLIYTRLGNPIGQAEVGGRAPRVENPRIR